MFFFFVVVVSSSFEERERYFAHDRDAPRQKIVIIVIRFLSVVKIARVENAHSS